MKTFLSWFYLPVLTSYPSPGPSWSWCSCSASGWCFLSAWTLCHQWSSAGCRARCPTGPGSGPSSASSTEAGTGGWDSRRADSFSASPRVLRCPQAEAALETWWRLLRFKYKVIPFSENKSRSGIEPNHTESWDFHDGMHSFISHDNTLQRM